MVITLIILLSIFLRLYRLDELMHFIGDQGWFYLSARDMILTGSIPLVGISSSHPWLHQGPLWTYMLVGTLLIGNFNPASGAYLSVFIGTISVLLMYRIGSEFFSKKLGLIAALLYSTSPLVVFSDRMPYHTSPIPFFVLFLFYSLIKWVSGKPYYFALSILSMSILYNLHLATVIFWPVIIFLLFKKLPNINIIMLVLVAGVLPMIPIFMYDLSHGFPQTLKYAAWFGYKFLQLVGLIQRGGDGHAFIETFTFFFEKYKVLTFNFGKLFSSMGFFLLTIVIGLQAAKKSKIISPFNIIFFSTIIGVIAYFVSNVPSDAYIVMLFPGLIFLFSYVLNKIRPLSILIGLVLFISLFNVYSLINSDFLMKNRLTLKERVDASKKIVNLTEGKGYNLISVGWLSDFESYTMNYKYLTWWLGNGPVKKEINTNIKVYIEESKSEIRISKNP